MGNRLTKSTSYSYDDADQMTLAGGIAHAYDNNGNLTSAGADTFAWDAEYRLVASTTGGTPATYAYNGDGLRTSRTVGGNGVSYIWDLNAALPVILQDSEGNRYVYGLDLLTRINGATEEWNLYDGLGSTTEVTDAAGAVTGSYQYDVFGGVRAQAGAITEWSYTGEQNDPTGLEYLRARYYDPGSGRFISSDPLAAQPGWLGHRFGYTDGNPVNLVDPLGLEPDGPQPVPLLPPGVTTEDLEQRCLRGWEDCYDLIEPRNRGVRPSPQKDICNSLLIQCMQSAKRGDPRTKFPLDEAKRRMRNLSTNPGGAVDRVIETLKDLPRPSFGLPDTGSGGYLPSRSKEGGSSCRLRQMIR